MNPFLDGPRTVLDLAGIRAWTTANERARADYYTHGCGTTSGHKEHRRMGEDPCQDCRDAYNEQARARWSQKKRRKEGK